jgi:hypothetical protein
MTAAGDRITSIDEALFGRRDDDLALRDQRHQFAVGVANLSQPEYKRLSFVDKPAAGRHLRTDFGRAQKIGFGLYSS